MPPSTTKIFSSLNCVYVHTHTFAARAFPPPAHLFARSHPSTALTNPSCVGFVRDHKPTAATPRPNFLRCCAHGEGFSKTLLHNLGVDCSTRWHAATSGELEVRNVVLAFERVPL